MIQPLFEHLPDIASPLAAAEHLLLFFDFDGTLAPIGDDPSKAFMSRETAAALGVIPSSPIILAVGPLTAQPPMMGETAMTGAAQAERA